MEGNRFNGGERESVSNVGWCGDLGNVAGQGRGID